MLGVGVIRFQCSSASRKFLNVTGFVASRMTERVSVLFSEPKIPQFTCEKHAPYQQFSFSALQRAENSSIIVKGRRLVGRECFSALQRAENSSIRAVCSIMMSQI